MATAPYSFPYPSAATYPLPPPFPGGYYYPYPSSYASSSYLAPPAPGFPVPAYGPSTFVPPPPWPPPAYPYLPPVSAYAPAPAFPSPISTQFEPNQPAPAATQIHGDLHHSSFGSPILSQPPPTRNPPIPNPSTPSVATSPDPSSSKAVFTSADNYLNHRFMEDDASVQAVTDERVPASSASSSTYRLNIQARQACVRTSFDAIQGQLAKLSSMLSRFAVSHDKQSTSAHASKPEKSQHITVVPAAPAHVASQVFAEMPTPSSSQGTHGSAPDYRSGHHTPIRSTCLLDGNSSLSEQNLDERSHRYDFPNLSRKTVFRADGTEQSYYALPENYPLQRAVPEPVCAVGNDKTEVDSNESGDVFTTTPEQQQPFEDVREESGQSRKCFSRPSETPLPEVISEFTLTDNVDVSIAKSIKFKHGQCIPQVSEYAYTPGCAIGDVLTDYKWNMLLSEERREVWDPGALLPLMSSMTQHYSPALQPASDATAQGRRDATAVYKVLILQLPMSTNSHVWDPGVKIFLCSWLIILTGWSATDTQFPCTHITSVAAHAADVTPVLGFKANNTAGSGSRLIPSLKLPMNVQEASHVLKQMPVYGLYEEDTSCLNCMEKQLARRFHKASDNAFSEQLRDRQLNVLVIIERRKEWDPGATEFPFLFITSAGATELQVTDVFKPEFTCSGETPKLLNSWVNLKKMILWPCCKLQISTPSKLPMQSLCETTSVKEEKDATPMHMIMVLHLEEVTAGKDGAALYQISTIQLPMRNTTHVWNPGVKKKYKAKNLLSSPNYLQIKEIDIIFSTFRPP